MSATNLRPFFGYYGGKWRDALKNYPVPRHQTIVEPFAGSAGYAMRYHDRKVILCERDPILVAVWRYLIAVSPEEILRIPDLPPGGSIDDIKASEEAKYLVGFWLNRGTAYPRRTASRWMRDKIRPGSFWGERVRTTIARQVPAIRHWKIVDGDYSTVKVSGPATWFIDPPYQKAGTHYRFGSDGIDFGKLAAWAKSRSGQIIVCENDGADWLPFVPLSTVKTTRAGRRSSEVVWLSDFGELPKPEARAGVGVAA